MKGSRVGRDWTGTLWLGTLAQKARYRMIVWLSAFVGGLFPVQGDGIAPSLTAAHRVHHLACHSSIIPYLFSRALASDSIRCQVMSGQMDGTVCSSGTDRQHLAPPPMLSLLPNPTHFLTSGRHRT